MSKVGNSRLMFSEPPMLELPFIVACCKVKATRISAAFKRLCARGVARALGFEVRQQLELCCSEMGSRLVGCGFVVAESKSEVVDFCE